MHVTTAPQTAFRQSDDKAQAQSQAKVPAWPRGSSRAKETVQFQSAPVQQQQQEGAEEEEEEEDEEEEAAAAPVRVGCSCRAQRWC